MRNMKKRIVVSLVAGILAISLTACGGTQNSNESDNTKVDNSSAQTQESETANETETSSQETPVQEEQQKTLSDFISMTNITFAPIEVYSASVDSYEPTQGYVIEATVSNESDMSCDVTPVLSAVITDTDNYGKEKSKEVILSLASPAISSPYCYENTYGITTESVGLAPHETKTVRYYIGATGGSNGSLNVAELDNIGFFERLFLSDIISITDIKLQSLSAEESEVVYIPIEEWANDVKIEEVEFDLSTGNIIMGTVTNNTDDRWKDGNIQFEITVNGQTLNSAAIEHTYKDFSFVDIGDIIQLCDSNSGNYSISESVASYESQGYKVELIPTLLGYTPDEE